eukprot:TRINITY_DN4969_c0_g1_i9.p1 TRINITY_DN4969_c0_g1~~TRINITY_DN4969_c0_g1_i9.p1  ORF type:complete len:419 (-),score=67.89 TRINITY_DN4969_c0_g1_i9:707-1963(-)
MWSIALVCAAWVCAPTLFNPSPTCDAAVRHANEALQWISSGFPKDVPMQCILEKLWKQDVRDGQEDADARQGDGDERQEDGDAMQHDDLMLEDGDKVQDVSDDMEVGGEFGGVWSTHRVEGAMKVVGNVRDVMQMDEDVRQEDKVIQEGASAKVSSKKYSETSWQFSHWIGMVPTPCSAWYEPFMRFLLWACTAVPLSLVNALVLVPYWSNESLQLTALLGVGSVVAIWGFSIERDSNRWGGLQFGVSVSLLLLATFLWIFLAMRESVEAMICSILLQLIIGYMLLEFASQGLLVFMCFCSRSGRFDHPFLTSRRWNSVLHGLSIAPSIFPCLVVAIIFCVDVCWLTVVGGDAVSALQFRGVVSEGTVDALSSIPLQPLAQDDPPHGHEDQDPKPGEGVVVQSSSPPKSSPPAAFSNV